MGEMEKIVNDVQVPKNIYQTISAVMEDCGFVAKDSTNPTQKYKYRGIDAVMNALNPAMRKHKLFVVPDVVEQTREERQTAKGGLLIYTILKVKYTFYAEDGSFVEAYVMGEAMDSGDKSMNKAMSAAFKYALFQVFCIPTEEMKDTEADNDPEPVYEKINNKEALVLENMLTENQKAWVLKTYKVESLLALTKAQHVDLMKRLQKQEEQKKEEQKKEKNGDKGKDK